MCLCTNQSIANNASDGNQRNETKYSAIVCARQYNMLPAKANKRIIDELGGQLDRINHGHCSDHCRLDWFVPMWQSDSKQLVTQSHKQDALQVSLHVISAPLAVSANCLAQD